MVARRKLYVADLAPNNEFRIEIERTTAKKKQRETMLKDMHLIEAAMATDRIIISLDEAVRVFFHEAASSVGELRIVMWANPDNTEEQCLVWLEGGAKAERNRHLGFIE